MHALTSENVHVFCMQTSLHNNNTNFFISVSQCSYLKKLQRRMEYYLMQDLHTLLEKRATIELFATETLRFGFVFVASTTSCSPNLLFLQLVRVITRDHLTDSWLLRSATKYVGVCKEPRPVEGGNLDVAHWKVPTLSKARMRSNKPYRSNWRNTPMAIYESGLWRNSSAQSDPSRRLLLLSDYKRGRFQASI